MPSNSPSPNGAIGRDYHGRFAQGNAGGPGNPHAAATAKLRAAMLKAITPAEITKVMRAMIRKAKSGDVSAAKEVIDRAIGKPLEPDLVARIEALELSSNQGKRP